MNIKSLRWRFPYKLNDISKMCILCLAHKQLLLYFKDFFLVFGFLRFEYDMARQAKPLVFILVMFANCLIHGLVSVISCGKFSVIVTSIIFFLPLSLSPSLLIFPSCVYAISFTIVSQSLDIMFLFFFFAFQFWEVSIGISFSSLVPCLTMDSLLMISSKAFFHFCYSNSFDFHHFLLILS